MRKENMNAAGTITNNMLYDLIKDFKDDMNRRFEQVDRQIDLVHKEIQGVKEVIKEDKQKLQEVYDARHKVTVDFTRSWMFGSFFIALLASTIVLAVSKAF